ncbi:MAG: hypothetical protein ACLGPM_06610 [Acidobacteriota bacterium]
MPIQKLTPPTLDEINRAIAGFEERSQMTSEDFVQMEQPVSQLDEDDAVEWLYLIEQRRALRNAARVQPYSRSQAGKSLKNCHDVLDRLAA